MPRNATLNIVYGTVTLQMQVKFEVSAVAQVEDGLNYFFDRGPMANIPPIGASTPQDMGLIFN